jgi:lipopolysaccharide biosynthesis regulator YciM
LGFAKLLRELDVNRLSDLANAGRLSGNTGPALEALQAVERRFAGTPQATDAGFLIGRIHAGSGATSKAILRFESYLEAGESARYSVEAIGRLIELYAAQGRKEPAEAMARRYLKRAPKGPYQRLAHSVLHAK